ncbi:MAG: alpha/beta hydrolase-fold protein [Pseudomonadota bacterium]
MIFRIALTVAMLAFSGSIAAQPVTVSVTLAPDMETNQSGRLIVFVSPVEVDAEPQKSVNTSPLNPTETAVAARDIVAFSPGDIATVDGEVGSFPTAFSDLAPGNYRFQAVLDRDYSYNYRGRGPGDIVSDVADATLPGTMPILQLNRIIEPSDPTAFIDRMPENEQADARAAYDAVEEVAFVSPRLSAFWGRDMTIRGWIALPPDYTPDGPTFPVVYITNGFSSNLAYARQRATRALLNMQNGLWPPMIWVILDQSLPTGTHEFADSVNNGPWGTALTEELIPSLEKLYAMDATPEGRFLTGHSSGGWASLWLQVRYPSMFGGSWPTAPDASSFRDFTNIDIYAEGANAYRNADGTPVPLIRNDGDVIATIEEFSRLEATLGIYGGQLASFDWVFSPKGPDGRPMQIFDRTTGAVDPQVAAYWRQNYDIAHIVRRDWTKLSDDLNGKIHLIVGDADTFYLDGPARLFEQVLDELGAEADFVYRPGRTHFDLFTQGENRTGLMRDIAWDIYAVARPEAERPSDSLPVTDPSQLTAE